MFLGLVIMALGDSTYILGTLRGKFKPNRVTFFLWALAPMIAFAAQITQGVGIQSLQTFSVGLFPLLIFLASFFNKKAEWKLKSFDLACGFFSIVGLVLWYLTKVGDIAIVFSLLADGLASLPTIVKSFNYPETEGELGYLGSGINAIIALLTIKIWDFTHASFVIYILLVDVIIFAFVHFRLGKLAVDTRLRT